MATREDYFKLIGLMAAARAQLAEKLASDRPDDVTARDSLTNQLDALEHSFETMLDTGSPAPDDGGIGAILGIGPGATAGFGAVPTPLGLPNYHDAVAAERLYAVGDLYYCYQLERLGIFRAIRTLQELFRAGKLRLSQGDGAFELYRFDRKEVLRHTEQERKQAYRRVFGYTDTPPPRGASANQPFHALFSQFSLRVAELFRDKRIAETFRPGSGAFLRHRERKPLGRRVHGLIGGLHIDVERFEMLPHGACRICQSAMAKCVRSQQITELVDHRRGRNRNPGK